MAVKLILALGLVLLVERTGATEALTEDILSPADVPQQAQETIADEVKEVQYLVETIEDLIEEEEDSNMDEDLEGEPSMDELGKKHNGLPSLQDAVDEVAGLEGYEEEEEQETAADGILEELRHVVGGIPRTGRVCEHQTLRIGCPAGQRINIVSVLYGRTSRQFCPNGPIKTTSCRASSSLSRVRTICRGKSSCSVSASNGVFGDPCRGTFKYLEVRYTCTGGTPPGCPGWTRWYDRDNPSATGDWETLSSLRRENPGQICARPSGIQARVKGSNQPASQTGQQFFKFNPLESFVCRNNDQGGRGMCKDYEVRFWCP